MVTAENLQSKNEGAPEENLLSNLKITLLSEMPGTEVEREQILQHFFKTARIVARGTEADVLVSRDALHAFCLKKSARTTPRTSFNAGMHSEVDKHKTAFDLLKEAEKQNIPLAKVPKPLISFRDPSGKDEWILMEFIPGKTLWRVIMEKLIETVDERTIQGWKREDLLHMDDETLSDYIVKIFRLSEISNPLKQLEALLRQLKDNKFLKKELFVALANTIRILNQNRFFHRDLHPQNIMFTENNVWLIDFAYSLYDPASAVGDPYEEMKMGQNLSFTHDEGILSVLKNFIEVSDEEKESQQQKEIKRIEQEAQKTIDLLVKRSNSKLNELMQSVNTSEKTGFEFVETLFEDKALKTEVIKTIASNSIDNFKKLVILIAILEYKRYKSCDGTRKFLDQLIRKLQSKPDILLNHMNQTITVNIPNEKR